MSDTNDNQNATAESGSSPRTGSATPFLDAYREIKELREDADEKTAKLLTKMGWNHTCQTPGCYWMFEKHIGDRTMLTDAETAMRYELGATDERYDDVGG